MSYVAVTHVGKWTPGEIIDEKLTQEQAGRLLDKGAIKLMVTPVALPQEEPPAPPAPPAPEAEEQPEEEADVPMEIDAADALVTKPTPKRTKARTRK